MQYRGSVPANDQDPKEDERTIGFGKVVRVRSAATTQFGGWGPKVNI